MKKFLVLGLSLLWASTANGVPSNATEDPRWNSTGYTLVYNANTGDMVAGTYVVGLTFPQARIGVERGSTFEGTLHACDTKTFAAATCDVVTTLGSDVANVIFGTARTWYVIVVDTAETAGFSTRVRIRGSFTQTTDEGAPLTTVSFGTNRAANYFSPAIQTCPTMVVTFFEATAVAVSLYATDPDDDTLVEIEAATLIVQFSASTSNQLVIRPNTQELRFVVDTEESSGVSVANVSCLQQVAALDEIIVQNYFAPTVNLNNAAFDYGDCIGIRGPWNSGAGCETVTRHLTHSKDLTLTRIVWIGSSSVGEDVAGGFSGTDGCTGQIFIDLLAVSGTALGELFHAPLATGDPAGIISIGERVEFTFANGGIDIPAGTDWAIAFRDGDFCQNGTTPVTCDCDTGTGALNVEVWGKFAL